MRKNKETILKLVTICTLLALILITGYNSNDSYKGVVPEDPFENCEVESDSEPENNKKKCEVN